MNTALEATHRIDPALWMQDVVGITPHAWQKKFLRAERGASIAILSSRQVGKTTIAAVAIAHSAVFMPGSLSVIACPTQHQSAEALRKVKETVLKAGAELTTDNKYSLELTNRSRVFALPDTEDSIRGLTVDAWIIADEAARLDPTIMAALHPMRTQRPNARFAMLSTAWSRTDPFWSVWEDESYSRWHRQSPPVARILSSINAEKLLLNTKFSFAAPRPHNCPSSVGTGTALGIPPTDSCLLLYAIRAKVGWTRTPFHRTYNLPWCGRTSMSANDPKRTRRSLDAPCELFHIRPCPCCGNLESSADGRLAKLSERLEYAWTWTNRA